MAKNIHKTKNVMLSTNSDKQIMRADANATKSEYLSLTPKMLEHSLTSFEDSGWYLDDMVIKLLQKKNS